MLALGSLVWIVALAATWSMGRLAVLALTLLGLALGAWVRVRWSRPRRPDAEDPAPPTWPFVSVHVPICNEPPELVRETLEALARVRYPAFEVIVLDNNTDDPALWRPVRARCAALGPRFRFEHVPHMEGFKAGALNRCLELSDPRAEYVFVADADYVVEPEALELAVRCARGEDATYVQFPQAYRNVAPGTEGLRAHYRHYFAAVLPTAQALGAPLLTGTMCLVSVAALREVGGWSDASITEDAQLGIELLRRGRRGRYVDRVIGRGLMPTSLSALRAQRRRWVFGNAQTLASLRLADLRRLGPRRVAAVALQLTAWFEPGIAVWVTTLAALALAAVGAPWATEIALATGGLVAAWWVFPLMWEWAGSGDLRRAAKARLVSAALSWEASSAWLEAWLGVRLPFVRTDKGAAGALRLRDCGPVLGVAATFLVGAGLALLLGAPALVLAAAGCALVLGGTVYTRRELAAAERVRALH
ncbi:MAG: glycosyltransferase [Myxococcota bacterium]|nr:glycosyltransferase [Myxococcota bacterium]